MSCVIVTSNKQHEYRYLTKRGTWTHDPWKARVFRSEDAAIRLANRMKVGPWKCHVLAFRASVHLFGTAINL